MAKKKAPVKTRKKAKKAANKAKQPKLIRREKNGHFSKGSSPNQGKKDPAAQMKREFTRWFKDAVTKEDITDIANNLIDIAKSKKSKGAVTAAKEIFDRCMGKAEQPLYVGGADGGPLPPITVILKVVK